MEKAINPAHLVAGEVCLPALSLAGEGERGDVHAAGLLAPSVHDDACVLALPGVGGEHLAVAHVARALAHVQLAGVVVVGGLHVLQARVEQGRVQRVAVAVTLGEKKCM